MPTFAVFTSANSISASAPRRLLNSDTAAVFAPPGHLLFVVQGTLLAQPFNLTKLELVGNPFAVAEQVARETAELGVTASRSGSIAYRQSAGVSERQLIWFDRAGNQLSTLGDALGALAEPSLSPSGDRVAFYGSADGNPDIWTMDTKRGVLQSIHVEPGRRRLSDLVARRPSRRLQFESKGRPRPIREGGGRRCRGNCCWRPRCRSSRATGHPMAAP
jgi:hypothetical protein